MASYFQYYSRQFWGVSPQLGELVARQIHDPAVVFVRTLEPEADMPQVRYLWFGSAFARMRPDFEHASFVYARDNGATNADLMNAFPNRSAYLYTGTIESGRLQLLRGPTAQ